MANPQNTNQGNQANQANQANQGQYGAGSFYGNPGQMGNQGQYGYTGYPGMANQGQMGQMGQMGNQGMYGAPGQMGQMPRTNIPTAGPHAGHGPQNYQRSDQRIKEDVSDRLTAHPHLDARGINVQVNNGEVTLTGTVDSRQDKREAENVADSVQGVKDVHNQLKVQPQQQGQTQQQAKTH